jgi:hypothetical protein
LTGIDIFSISFSQDPLPNLPPGGKEKIKLFPLGGNGKGGKGLKNNILIIDI